MTILGLILILILGVMSWLKQTAWAKRMIERNIQKGLKIIKQARERVLSGEVPADPCDQETPTKDPFDPDLKCGDPVELPTLEKKGGGHE